MIENVRKIEKTQSNFGLIHNDFTFYNYFVDDNRIRIFDFGDCGYGYFMYDIAILFLSWISKPDANAMLDVKGNLELLLPAFRKAYEKHVSVAENDWDNLKIFMQLRQIKMATNLIMNNQSNDTVIGGKVEKVLSEGRQPCQSGTYTSNLINRCFRQEIMLFLSAKC